MLDLLSTEELAGIPTLVLPLDESGSRETPACQRCEAFRPDPQISGNLQVDPEIHLPSPGMDVDIAYYYNATSRVNGPFGYGRTASPNLTAQASGSPALVTLTRGNGAIVNFLDNGSGTFVAQTPGVLNSLVKDTVNGLWKETTPDGRVTAYPLNTTGQVTSLVYARDAVGNTHSYTYSGGLLQTIQDAVGRFVTFGYSGNLVQSIQDWAGRRTTFQYNTASASPRNLLTTVIGPTGCQTGYQYGTFALSTLSFGVASDWLLSGIVDPNGYGTSYTYDRQKRVVTRTVAGVGTTTYLYQPNVMLTIDVLGNLTTQTTGANFSLAGMQNPLGALVTFTRNANNQETSRQTATGAVWTTSYDASGNVTGRIDPLGQQTTFSYDGFNNLTKVQTPDGAVVTNIWGYGGSSFDTTGAKRRLQAQVNPLGYITSYGYNARGQFVSVQSPLGFLSTVGYDSFGNPITGQDPLGNISTRVFDLAGNVIGQVNPLGATWSTTYDNQNRPLTQQDPLGNVSTAGYDSVGNRVVTINPLGYRTSTSFNVFNQPVSQVDALGNVSTAVYDALGRAIASIDALGNRSSAIFDSAGRMVANVDPLGNTRTTVFDIASRPVAQVDPLGNFSTTVFDLADRVIASVDALGNYSTTIFDSVSRPVARQNALGFFSTTIFDLAGQRIASVDALGSRYSTTFDQMGRAVASVDPLGRTNTTVFDQASRAIVSVDALGFRTTTNFDAAGRAISRQDVLNRLSTTVFDAANRTIGWVDALNNRSTTNFDAAGRAISTADPLNRVSSTIFDPLNRPIASVSPLGYRTTTNFDADGRTISRQDALGRLSTNVFDAASRQIATVSPLGYRFTTLYDAASRSIASQDALGFSWTNVFDADGRFLARVDPLGNRSSSVFDAVGQTIGQVDALGNRTSTVFDAVGRTRAHQDSRGYLTSFVFDAAGQQIAIVTANGGISTSLFDQRGLVTANQDPLGAYTTYQFDAVGNAILRTDARNLVTSYTVDALNRTVGTLYVDSTRVTNTFDAAGQQTTEQDVTGTTSYSYDRDGRQVAVLYPAGNALTYSLDAVGNRVLLTDPDNGLTTYSWDAQDRLVGIVNPFAEWTTIQYDALSREQHRVLGNGLNVSHTYDAAGRETVLSNASPAGTAWAVFTNTYDAVGNRLSVKELDGSAVAYAYDASCQLTNEQRTGTTPYNTTFVYDGMGNRLVQNDTGVLTSYTYNAANELLTSQVTVSSTFYQINSGGGAVAPFAADGHFGSSSPILTASTGSAVSTAGVTNPAPQACYQTMLMLANGSVLPLFYVLPSLTPGAVYKVRLHWASFTDGSAGQRSMNVLVNGAPVISHFDVFAAAGGDLKAIVKEVSGIADGAGNLVIAFSADQGFPIVSAFINALEVLNGSGLVTNTYDPNGNLLTAADWTGTTTYTWDSENRLLTVASALNGTETYTYAADGMRRQKVTSAQTKNFVWDGQNVLQERNVSNVRLAQYTDYPGEWGGLASGRQGSTSSFYAFDSQGSARILVNIGGTITDSYSYKVFGLEMAQGTAPQAQYTTNPYRYVGRYGYYRDNISRLYVRARYFESALGRWNTWDPIGFSEEDWNLYRYMLNSPVNGCDPSGLIPFVPKVATCTQILDCLHDPSRQRCSCSQQHPNSDEQMICYIWNESNFGKQPGKYGGMAHLTSIAWAQMIKNGCASNYSITVPSGLLKQIMNPPVPGSDDYDQYIKILQAAFRKWAATASECLKIQITQDFIGCVGLEAAGPGKGRLGDYRGITGRLVHQCEKCLQRCDAFEKRQLPIYVVPTYDQQCISCGNIIHS